eukprot:TRINITY_DN2999_c0_g3_i1.p1 TRINITY_DN2999_c0_g3~~TRINITY_DN2999_c0_g3_i1.p1  ORF type:complete len:287 (+),score=63.16 TRINITY_DN2999_c0_g3_i1:42-863(+)
MTFDTSMDIYAALLKHTNKRAAREYAGVLRDYDIKALKDLLSMSSEGLDDLKLTPHLRQVCGRVRREKTGMFTGTPVDGWVNEKSLMAAVPLVVVLGYFMQITSLFDIIERMTALMVLCVILVILFTRSLYVLLHEETMGTIKIYRKYDDSEEFTAHIATTPIIPPSIVEGTGDSIGVLIHEILLSPFLTFLGFDSRLSWSSVVAIDERSQTHKPILTVSSIAHDSWITLERLPWIPGVRAIERKIVMKSAPDGASFIVKKSKTGGVWFEQEK